MVMSTPRTAIEAVDPELARAIADEERRQRGKIELIASENYASAAVLAAQGSVLTNKYAEGYPGKRYYGGCEYVDVAESLAIARAKALFGAAHANVQPHSGSSANLTAYFSLIEPGDTVMGMSLAQGGHLTHGSPVNFSGKFFHFVAYGVDRESERIDMDEVARLAREHRPKLIIGGATAYSRLWDFARFRQIADEVGAIFLVDMAHFAGLVAGGVHPNPVPHAQVVTSTTHKTLRGPRGGFILTNDAELGQKIDKSNFPGFQGGPLMHVIAAKAVAFHEAQQPAFRDYARRVVQNARALAEGLQAEGLRIVSGGTDNHLLLLDLTSAELSGKAAEKALDAVGITTNKNTIPFDQRSPMVTSGLRLGSPAVTTRGFGPDELRRVARWIAQVLAHRDEPAVTRQVADEVAALTGRFPVPGIADS